MTPNEGLVLTLSAEERAKVHDALVTYLDMVDRESKAAEEDGDGGYADAMRDIRVSISNVIERIESDANPILQ